jgi:hypothetical protein
MTGLVFEVSLGYTEVTQDLNLWDKYLNREPAVELCF